MTQSMWGQRRDLGQRPQALEPIGDQLIFEGQTAIDEQMIGWGRFPNDQISLNNRHELVGHGNDPIAIAFAALDPQTAAGQVEIGQAQVLDFAFAQAGVGQKIEPGAVEAIGGGLGLGLGLDDGFQALIFVGG
jgi:hypothetical protein